MTEATTPIEGQLLTFPGTPELNAALAAVQAELPSVHKAETADTGSYTYSYADLASVSAAVLPLLGAHGLAFTAWPSVNDQGKFVLRYELLHKSGEQKAGEYPIGGGNAQQIGSSITYARRYALCAVTGVAPDDDDDAAAAVGAREVQQTEQHQATDRARHAAVDAVRGAWFNQYGEWNLTAASDMFSTWSRGGDLRTASVDQLKSFAGYLHTLPVAEAGSTPDPTPPATDQPREAQSARPMTPRQRGMLFALLGDLGINDANDQREHIGRILERPIESRGDLTSDEAKAVIDALQQGVPIAGDGAAPSATDAGAVPMAVSPAAPSPGNA
ncbi:ERF family protein [Kribbella sp. WER1]